MIKIQCTVKLLISARAAITFRRALYPAAIGGRRLLDVFFKFSIPVHPAPIRGRHLLEARRLLEVSRSLCIGVRANW